MVAANDHKLVLDFDDNRLLAALYGAHDCHLARIEETLDIQAVNRGNLVVLQGERLACERAQVALKDLYARLKSGREITRGDVDGALRMTLAPVKNGTGHANSKGEVRTQKRAVAPRSPNQAAYIDALYSKELVIGTGPAGTGKTYLAVAVAASMLVEGRIDRIILSRPAVEAGESLGFLPGDMRDKVDPYLRPLYDALYDMLPGPQVMRSMESGEIEIAPLAFMRGRTLANSFVILDEAQNATPMQMKMFLTRMGENSRMVITGDPTQIDLPFGAKSGLRDALEILPRVKGVEIINFTESDVVRHDMVTRIVKAYRQRDMKLTDKKEKMRQTRKSNQEQADASEADHDG
ncbi:MAG: PhoH family protein [Parvibaculales bacterium]